MHRQASQDRTFSGMSQRQEQASTVSGYPGSPVGKRTKGRQATGTSERGGGLVPGQRSKPDAERLDASAVSRPRQLRNPDNDPGKALCGGCGHRRCDHGQRTCLVCFTCSKFTPSMPAQSTRADRAKCACNHRRDRHDGGTGSCGAAACPCHLYRPQIPEGAWEDRISVHAILAGGFESDRRRH
jgi:hypothetical protein